MSDREQKAEVGLEACRVTPTAPHAERAPARVESAEWLSSRLPLSLDAYERAALERALVEAWGDASEAARLLGIGRSTFYRKAGKHGINLGELRAPVLRTDASESDEDATRPIGVGARGTLG